MKRNSRLLLGLTSVIFTLACLELIIRIQQHKLFDTTLLSAQYEAAKQTDAKPRAQYDELLGWVPHDGVRRDGPITYTIIEKNLRSNGSGGSRDIQKNGILALGDSFTFGEDVNDAETWPAYLEKLSGIPVLNGAVFNYGLDQIVLRAEILLPQLKPRLLLVSIIPDDINRCTQAVRLQAKPYFIIRDGHLVLRNVPVPLPSGEKGPRKMDLFRRYFGYSYLADFIMRRINVNYWLNVRIELVKDEGWGGADNGDALSLGYALIDRLANLCERYKTKVVVIVQHEKYLFADQAKMAASLLRYAQGRHIDTLDLWQPLEEKKQRDPEGFERLFNVHMSAAGNQFVAQEIYQYLLAQDLLAGRGNDGNQ